jgi:hypothetical protein
MLSLYGTIRIFMQSVQAIRAIVLMFAICIWAGCRKTTALPVQFVTDNTVTAKKEMPQLKVSSSRVLLLQGNAGAAAAGFEWDRFPVGDNEGVVYVLEACIDGDQFANPVEIASSRTENLNLTVEDLNTGLRSILLPEEESKVDFRIRMESHSHELMYSQPVAMGVTVYQPLFTYSDELLIRLPGNYQSWKISSAPYMIDAGRNGEYEGYINFTNKYPNFLMVKSIFTWDDNYTFSDIGAGKFGFGGKMFAIWEGAGIYKCNASTNTNTWSCRRITTFSLKGSATGNQDLEMKFNTFSGCWAGTIDLSKGSFLFMANHSDEIVLGQAFKSSPGNIAYNGSAIPVPTAGKYMVRLSLMNAGNYSYALQRIY